MLSRKLVGWIGAGVLSAALVPAGLARVHVRHTSTNAKVPAKTTLVTSAKKPSKLSSKTPAKAVVTKAVARKTPVHKYTALKTVSRKTATIHSRSRHLSTVSHRLPLHRTTHSVAASHHSTLTHLTHAKKTTLTSNIHRPVSKRVVKTAAMVN